jgi:two-component system, sporulation sensor kinase E
MDACEPGQVRKEAAISKMFHVPEGCLIVEHGTLLCIFNRSAPGIRLTGAFFMCIISIEIQEENHPKCRSVIKLSDARLLEGVIVVVGAIPVEVSYEAIHKLVHQYCLCPAVIWDGDGELYDCNNQMIALLGIDPAQETKRNVKSLIRMPGNVLDIYTSCFAAQPACSELPQVVLEGEAGRRESQRYELLELRTAESRYFIHLFQDLSEPHKVAAALQLFPGTFMRDVNLGVIVVNADFILTDVSEMACRVLGFHRDEVLEKPMEDVFSSVPDEYRLMQRTILDGAIIRNHAMSWTNDQARYELLMDSNVLKDEHGQRIGAYLIFKDVTNLRSLEEQVQRSDRLAMIGQIAAGTAHEIRNPLTSIRGFLQMFEKKFTELGMDKERGYTDIMLQEINRINELVNEFLLLSKPKNITLEVLHLSHVLREVLPIINNEAILHSVSVRYHSAYKLPQVIADREMMKQVLINLCKNGIEAMGEGGTLTITERFDHQECMVFVDIHDTGPGIPSFLIDKIFDPFFTTKEKGTGLGLSVCQRIVHDLGGVIRVSSKGYGTTFTVSIPYSV